MFKGGASNKTVTLANAVKGLVVDYSEEHNLTQRKVLEMALVDFFLKYGYEQRVSEILSVERTIIPHTCRGVSDSH